MANINRNSSGCPGRTTIHRGLTRRDFIRNATVSAGLGLALGHRTALSEEPSRAKSKVVLVRDETVFDDAHNLREDRVAAMLRRAVQSLTGKGDPKEAWSQFVKPTDVVGIKVTLMITRTSPELLRSIIRDLNAVGVPDKNIYIWDRATYGIGLEGVTRRSNPCSFDSRGYCTLVTDTCTVLLNIPGAKVHWLSGIGVTLKNWFGAINSRELPISGNRNAAFFALHEDSCADMGVLASVAEIRQKCKLNIVEAFRPLFHGGPQVDPKYLWDYKGLFVSPDPVALDAVCAKMLQAKRDEYKGEHWAIEPPTKHIVIADSKYHLGTSNLDQIELVKEGYQEGVLL